MANKVKEFSLVTKLEQERKSKSGAVEAKKAEVEALKKELKDIQGDYEQAIFAGTNSKELDSILDSKAVIESKLNRRKDELETIISLGIFYSVGSEEFANAYNKEYLPQVKKEVIEPHIAKLEALKASYLKELSALQTSVEGVKAEAAKAHFFLTQLNKGKSTVSYMASLGMDDYLPRLLGAPDLTGYNGILR